VILVIALLAAPWLAPLLTWRGAFDHRSARVYAGVAALVVTLAVLAALTSPALTSLGRLLVPLVAVVGALAVGASIGPVHGIGESGRRRWYFLWLQAFWWALLLLAMSANLGLSWLAIELTTLTSGALVAISGRHAAVEAAWKYLILCSAGLLIALLGVLILYSGGAHGAAPSIGVLDYGHLARHLRALPAASVRLALVCLTVGLGTKIGFAPMHTWLPDAHSEAPAPASGLLSGILLPLVLVVLWQAAGATGPVVGRWFGEDLLIGFGLVTILVATPFLLVQLDLKRLLAYSTMEQMGLMAIGLGTGNRLALVGALAQLTIHALVKSGLFFVGGDVLETLGSKKLPRVAGLIVSHPRLGWMWLLGLLTIAGLPPLPLFLAEFAIVFAAFGRSVVLGLVLCASLAVVFIGLGHYLVESVLGVVRNRRTARPRPSRGVGWRAAMAAFVLAVPVGLVLPALPQLYAFVLGAR